MKTPRYSKKPRVDLTGQRFGRLVVLEFIPKIGHDWKYPRWKCICDCGKTVFIETSSLTTGNTQSCGCLWLDKVRESTKAKRSFVGEYKHGHTRIYRIWRGMCQRCYDQNCKAYRNYGARGVTICDEWRSDAHKFQEWALKNGYDDTLSIDRIDNDGNYDPSNCRWVSHDVQDNNKRTNVYLKIGDESMTAVQWDKKMGFKLGTVKSRLRMGWSPERAVQTPVRPYQKVKR